MNDIVQNNLELKKKWLRIRDNSLKDLLQFCFHRKYWIVGVFLMVAMSSVFIALSKVNVFVSDAEILIAVGRENIHLDPTIERGQILDVFQEKEKLIRNEIAIMTSQLVAENVVEKVGAPFILNCEKELPLIQNSASDSRLDFPRHSGKKDTAFLDAVNVLTSNFSVEADRYLINLRYTNGEPHCAQFLLNELIMAYNDRHIELNKMFAGLSYFEEHVEQSRNALIQIDEEIETYREKNNIASIREQKVSLVSQIESLQNKLDTTSSNILATVSKITSIENNLKERSRTVELYKVDNFVNPVVVDVKPKLLDLKLQEANLAARFTDDYRPLIEVRERIKIAEQAIMNEPETRTQVTQGLNDFYTQLEITKAIEEANFKSYIGEQASLSEMIAQRKKELKDLSEKEVQLDRMSRDKELKEKEYQSYTERLQRARLNESLDMEKISNVKILQPPRLLLWPVSPNRRTAVLSGLLLGLAAGFGAAFIVHYVDDTMSSNEEVERKLGLRVLAYVTDDEYRSSQYL